MASALQFLRTLSGLTIILDSKPYNIASTDLEFSVVVSLIKRGATEETILAAIARATDVSSQRSATCVLAETLPGNDGTEDDAARVPTGLIRGSYVGEKSNGEFDIIAEGNYLTSFDSLDSALDYAAILEHRYDLVIIKNGDNKTVAIFPAGTVELQEAPSNFAQTGVSGIFQVMADGEGKGFFDSLLDAKAEAIRLFGSDRYLHAVVQNAAGEYVFSLDN